MKNQYAFIISLLALAFTACTENYSTGERIGVITKFAKQGLIWDSWEGELHVTQTGMNSTMNDFDFSIDNNNEPLGIVSTLDSAAQNGWKVKISYHEVCGKNLTGSRGHTNFFATHVQVLDKHFNTLFNNSATGNTGTNPLPTPPVTGHVIDTIYVIIDKSHEK